MNNRNQRSSYVLRSDLTIPAGTTFGPAPTRVQRDPKHVEALIGLGPDSVISVVVPIEDDDHFGAMFDEAS